MGKSLLIVRYMTALLGAALLLGGCAMVDSFLFGDEEEFGPSELMIQGMESLEGGDYKGAVEAYQALKDRYPYSEYAITAELKLADALYLQETYEEAYEAYDEFEKLHPKNKDIPYVIYQKGMCHFLQMKTNDREQSHTLSAREEFERVIKRFPRDDHANRARKNLSVCLVFLAEYELKVGHFYFKMGKYRAALARYSYVIHTYPDMGQYHEALEYIGKCKKKIAEEKEDEVRAQEKEKPQA
jgi:outer membrane protein assembly factor BamD